jgi:adenylate cyclase
MVGATVLVVVVFGLAWWQPWITHEEPASVERMAFSLPDKPSIAILPFTNMSDDPEQRYFADGMTDDLITDLSKISGLFVISRNSAFTYKDKPVKIRQVAEDLGVRYVMEGSVRRAGDQVRINAQLIDATTGGHLWAERYDGNISDIFVLQDQVVQKIVVSLAVNLTLEEQERQATNQETGSMRAYDEYLKGWQSYLLTTEEGHDKAAKHLEQAINLDPTYSRAHAMLATVYYQNSVYGWSSDGEKSKRQLELALKKPTPLAHRLASNFLANEERWDEAIDEAARGIILDPNDPEGYAAMGKVLDRSGEPVKAMEFYDKALRLDPTFPSADLLCYTGYNQFQLGRYEDSAVTLERSVTRSPGYHASYPVLAAAYGYLGRDREARDVIEAYNNIRGFQVNMTWLTNRTFSTPEPRERMREGLRKAGILE